MGEFFETEKMCIKRAESWKLFIKKSLWKWLCFHVRKFEEHVRSHLNIILRKIFTSQITIFPLRTKDQSSVTLNSSTVSAHKSALTSVSLRNLRHSHVWHQNFLFHPVKKKNRGWYTKLFYSRAANLQDPEDAGRRNGVEESRAWAGDRAAGNCAGTSAGALCL